MTIIEKILAKHAGKEKVMPGEIVDIIIDVRLARDFGGANVVKNLKLNNLNVKNPKETYFTFDCNPTGSDQKYAANQQKCRLFARDNNIKIFDVDSGIGTHLAIDECLAMPGDTVVSTDSHANILGAIGAFGQGMGDRDIAAAWANGKVWFRVPESVKINLTGTRARSVAAKDIILNLLRKFGANSLLGYSVEIYGKEVDRLSLDERITISSMATELGAIAILIPPTEELVNVLNSKSKKSAEPVYADSNAIYKEEFDINLEEFEQVVALPGHPHNVAPISEVKGTKIDSAFIGSCTNGRIEDMYQVAEVLNGRKIAPGVVLKIVPSTDEVWQQCLKEGLLEIFKNAGALIGNAGCAGCASGQIGQNGPGEVTISTGNRNFAGKQGKGEVYLASPATAAASAIAGHITTADDIPESPSIFIKHTNSERFVEETKSNIEKFELDSEVLKETTIEGRIWLVESDDIDTDMIFHNQHLAITEISEMAPHTFGNLKGWEDFPHNAQVGDIVITGKNFGAGSSRQQAVDCFKALGVQAIIAKSFGAIYERNAINAGFPILSYNTLKELELVNNDRISVNFKSGEVINLRNSKKINVQQFSEVQLAIFQKGDLLKI